MRRREPHGERGARRGVRGQPDSAHPRGDHAEAISAPATASTWKWIPCALRGTPAPPLMGFSPRRDRAPPGARAAPGVSSTSCRSRRSARRSPRAIAAHQVVIVCGETGSGKTTQLAQDLPRASAAAIAGSIGHTQPRRIAARATAARIAQELKTELGGAVGYKIRFTDKVGPRSYIKLMTDGILLAETQGDRELRAVRHAHHRRGARAQPQHRLPARLREAAAAAPARSQADRHLGDHRRRSGSRGTSTARR